MLVQLSILCFRNKKSTGAALSPRLWSPSFQPDDEFTLEALTAYTRVVTNWTRKPDDFSFSFLQHNEHVWGQRFKGPPPSSFQREGDTNTPQCLQSSTMLLGGRCDRRRWDGEEGEAIHARLTSRTGSNNCKPRPPPREKCVSADSGASGSELIAKRKDGVNSQWIDARFIGYVSVWPHMTYRWSVRVKAPAHT